MLSVCTSLGTCVSARDTNSPISAAKLPMRSVGYTSLGQVPQSCSRVEDGSQGSSLQVNNLQRGLSWSSSRIYWSGGAHAHTRLSELLDDHVYGSIYVSACVYIYTPKKDMHLSVCLSACLSLYLAKQATRTRSKRLQILERFLP